LFSLLLFFYARTDGFVSAQKLFRWGLTVIPIIFFALIGAAFVQYQSIYVSHHTYDSLMDHGVLLIVYRIFISNNDALPMAFDLYPDYLPFTSFNGIGLFASILGLEAREVSLEIPRVMFGTDLTSIQAGFMLSGYTGFGYFGILFTTILLMTLVGAIYRFSFRIRSRELWCLYLTSVGISCYFLTSSAFHTALLSGGVLLNAFFILLLDRMRSKAKTR
jgi:hypothetical protein